jgi:hypothetical protein
VRTAHGFGNHERQASAGGDHALVFGCFDGTGRCLVGHGSRYTTTLTTSEVLA